MIADALRDALIRHFDDEIRPLLEQHLDRDLASSERFNVHAAATVGISASASDRVDVEINLSATPKRLDDDSLGSGL